MDSLRVARKDGAARANVIAEAFASELASRVLQAFRRRLVSERRTRSTETGHYPIDANGHRTRRSSIFLRMITGSILCG